MTIYSQNGFEINYTMKVIQDMITERHWREFCFRLFNNNDFVCKYSIGLMPNENVEDYYKSVIETLKPSMI